MSMTEKLAYIKKLRHLTTEEIAQQSGVPLGTLNKIFSGQTKNPAVGPVDKITQVLRIPIHYLLDDELPIEYHVSTSTDDGILLLSSEEIQFLMKYRDLEPHSKRAVDTAGTILLCKMEHASRQEYGLFLLNQEAFIRRLYYKRGITKLVAPNLNFKDIIIHENDSLKCIGTITGIAHGCRWE